jgi:hypothetical protein
VTFKLKFTLKLNLRRMMREDYVRMDGPDLDKAKEKKDSGVVD